MSNSIFATTTIYKHKWKAEILWHYGHGGVPSDPKVAAGFIKTKLSDKEDLIQQLVAQLMVERGISAEEAAEEAGDLRYLNGFKRDENGLYIEGRQVKACIKEAASIAVNTGLLPADKAYGVQNKKTSKHWIPEHVFVEERRVYLGVSEADSIHQRFKHLYNGSTIQLEEEVTEAKLSWTVSSDSPLGDDFWVPLWQTAEQNGLGASRSLGFGQFEVTAWDKLCDCTNH